MSNIYSTPQNKQGFTLVELSIVLVIIGLLIGGILVGQSLVESAKINAQFRQIEQFNIAASNFNLKYNSLPGDTLVFTPQGNNDKIINAGSGFEGQEAANFWKHLSESGFQPESKIYTNTLAGTEVTNDNIPEASYEDNGGVAMILKSGVNYFVVADFFGQNNDGQVDFQAFGVPKGLFTPTTSLSIDKKFDDGVHDQGDIISENQGITFGTDSCAYSPTLNPLDLKICKLMFKLLPNEL